MDNYLKPVEISKMLKVSTKTVKRWCKAKQFEGAIYLGGKMGWRIPEESFKKFLEQRKYMPKGEIDL